MPVDFVVVSGDVIRVTVSAPARVPQWGVLVGSGRSSAAGGVPVRSEGDEPPVGPAVTLGTAQLVTAVARITAG
jgi:hypothetical protein